MIFLQEISFTIRAVLVQTGATSKEFLENTGFYVSRYTSADLMFAFCEAGGFSEKCVKKGSFGYWFSHKFESSVLRFLAPQSVTISVKAAPVMHCFLCGELNAKPESLDKYDVPVCESCMEVEHQDLVNLYLKDRKVTVCTALSL